MQHTETLITRVPGLYSYGLGINDRPFINLALANGFPPETYAPALGGLSAEFPTVTVPLRPYWGTVAPSSLTHWRQLGDDLLEQLDRLTPDPVVGIGHSVGGVATMYAAIKRPDKFSQLILIDPTLLSPVLLGYTALMRFARQEGRYKLLQGALKRRNRWSDLQEAIDYFRPKKLFSRFSPDMLHRYAEGATIPHPEGGLTLAMPREWEAQIFRTLPTTAYRLPSRLKVPTHIIRGELTDVFVPASAALFKLLNPRVTIETIAGVGHLIPQEAPEETGRQLMQAINRQRSNMP